MTASLYMFALRLIYVFIETYILWQISIYLADDLYPDRVKIINSITERK